MLQQTRVAAVVPFYERFLERFPDVGALARSRLDTVLALWAGLGYYRRARFLHAAARRIAREGMPETAADWRRLPGVGAYTAAAVASIAFGERAAVVDGNVGRVLCRLEARTQAGAWTRVLAQSWLSPRAPGNHNQAVMELGATVCTPRAPRCPRCPLRDHCEGRAAPGRYPAPRRREAVVEERRDVLLARSDGRVWLRRHEGAGLLAGLWDLPPAARPAGEPIAVVRHSILNRRLVLSVFRGKARGKGRWHAIVQLGGIPLAAGARKCLRQAGVPVVESDA